MGGTFDPVHHGHLSAANEVATLFDLDEVVFVPTGQPWQKSHRSVSPAEDRYLMTVVATASNPRFSVSRTDIDRPGPTYTVDTLRDLRGRTGPTARCSSSPVRTRSPRSSAGTAPTSCSPWRTSSASAAPGYAPVDLGAFPDGAVTLVQVPALAISSTDCRDRVGRGHPVWYLVPDGVVQYIEKRRLYRPAGAAPAGTA